MILFDQFSVLLIWLKPACPKLYLNWKKLGKPYSWANLFDTEIIGISRSTASKEYALETTMRKMKSEWETIVFECAPYRESGVSILSSVEDVQQMLDDHILKAQVINELIS